MLAGLSGLGMGLNFRFGFTWMDHNGWFGAHLWFGLAGWFGLLITGFSYKMLPMFYLSHGHSEKPQSLVLALWAAAVGVGAGSSLAGLPKELQLAAFGLLAAALIVYCIHIAQIYARKHKKTPGYGIIVSVCSTFLLTGAVLAFLGFAILRNDILAEESTYAYVITLYLWGWIAPVILGYMSKIVPFLWWTLKYGPLVGKTKTPLLADLVKDRHIQILLTAWLAAALALIASTGASEMLLLQTSAVVWSALSLAYIGMIAKVFTK